MTNRTSCLVGAMTVFALGLSGSGCTGGSTGQPSVDQADNFCGPSVEVPPDELRAFVQAAEGRYTAPLFWLEERVTLPTLVSDVPASREGTLELQLKYLGVEKLKMQCDSLLLPFEVTVSTDDNSFDGSFLATLSYSKDVNSFSGSLSMSSPGENARLLTAAEQVEAEAERLKRSDAQIVVLTDASSFKLPTLTEFFGDKGVEEQGDCAGNESGLVITEDRLDGLLCLQGAGLAATNAPCGGIEQIQYGAAVEQGAELLGGGKDTHLEGELDSGLLLELDFEKEADLCHLGSRGLLAANFSLSLGNEREQEMMALYLDKDSVRLAESELCLTVSELPNVKRLEDYALGTSQESDCRPDEQFICDGQQEKYNELAAFIDEGVSYVEICVDQILEAKQQGSQLKRVTSFIVRIASFIFGTALSRKSESHGRRQALL